MADAELIVVCIDSSTAAKNLNNIKPQLDAIKLYCKAKLDANPETKVVLFTMGSYFYGGFHRATSEYQKIQDYFKHICPGGTLRFESSINFACNCLYPCPPNKQKRMLFLVGSLVDVDDEEAVGYGMHLKDSGIAVDVVNFYLGEKPKYTTISNQYGREELDAFVDAANSEGNSHIEHVAPGSSILPVLSKFISRKDSPGRQIITKEQQDAEFIFVCVDDSRHIEQRSDFYRAQRDAIKYYCKTKLDANPKTEVVFCTMGALRFGVDSYVISNSHEIMYYLLRLGPCAGRLMFRSAINHFRFGFSRCPPNKHKRMVFFVRGLVDLDEKAAVEYGKKLKDLGIAVDVVNFYLGKKAKNTTIANQFGWMELDAFVAAANYGNNSHIEHVKHRFSIRQVLSKSMLRDSLRLLSMKNHKKETGKNQTAGDDKHVPSEALIISRD